MRNLFLTVGFFAFALFLLAGCNGAKGEPLKESTKPFIRENLDYKTDYHKKRIAVDGYLWLDASSMEGNKLKVSLYTKPHGEGDRLIDISTKRDDSADTVMFPMKDGKTAGYNLTKHEVNLSEMTFRDHENYVYPVSQKVQVSGTVTYVDHFQGGFSKMEDPMNKGKELYPFTLENPRFDILK